MKKPILDFCCCCCDLKVGCCIFVVFSLFCAVIGAVFGFAGVIAVLCGPIPIPSLFIFSFFIDCVGIIITDILFLNGVSAKKSQNLLPLVIYRAIEIVLITIGSVVYTINFAMNDGREDAIILSFISSIFVLISTYCTVCLYSFYITMKYPATHNIDSTVPFYGSNNSYQQFLNYPYRMGYSQSPNPPNPYTSSPYPLDADALNNIKSSNPPNYTTSTNEQNK